MVSSAACLTHSGLTDSFLRPLDAPSARSGQFLLLYSIISDYEISLSRKELGRHFPLVIRNPAH